MQLTGQRLMRNIASVLLDEFICISTLFIAQKGCLFPGIDSLSTYKYKGKIQMIFKTALSIFKEFKVYSVNLNIESTDFFAMNVLYFI